MQWKLGRNAAMADSKNKGRHSRDERLKKIAETENVEAASSEEGQADEPVKSTEGTGAATSKAEVAPTGPDADEDAFAGLDREASGFPLGMAPAAVGSYVAPDYAAIRANRHRRALKVFGISVGAIVAVLLIVYIAGAVVFMGRFLPHTVIGDDDVSMKTDEEVLALLEEVPESYTLDMAGVGFSYRTSGPEIGMKIDSQSIVDSMHADLDAWRWPVLIFMTKHDESDLLQITYDEKVTKKAIKKAVKAFNKDATAPTDATIVFDEKSGTFTIKSEEEGTQVDAKAINAVAKEAILSMEPTALLTEEQLRKPKVYSTDEKLKESAELATGMVSVNVKLNMNGQQVNEIGGNQLQDCVKIDKNLKVTLDEDMLNAKVREIANGYDTIGTERHYTRADGKQITVSGGVYGWEVDTAATEQMILEAVKAGEDTTIDIPCITTAAVYNGPGERDWGARYIDVDIAEQHVTFYGDNGKVIWEADCISGSPDGKHDTVKGVWTVNNKESPSTLIGYLDNGEKEYETKVQYWMAFEGNGIGFHDATWQPGFGGSLYSEGLGSHGCVNLSLDSAKSLYDIIQVGDVVVVHG